MPVSKKSREAVALKVGEAFLEMFEFLSVEKPGRTKTPIDHFLARTSPAEKHVAIGKRIAQKRAELELRQEEVAGLLNISQPVYSRIEAGSKILSIVKAQKLAEVLKTSIQWILTGK